MYNSEKSNRQDMPQKQAGYIYKKSKTHQTYFSGSKYGNGATWQQKLRIQEGCNAARRNQILSRQERAGCSIAIKADGTVAMRQSVMNVHTSLQTQTSRMPTAIQKKQDPTTTQCRSRIIPGEQDHHTQCHCAYVGLLSLLWRWVGITCDAACTGL